MLNYLTLCRQSDPRLVGIPSPTTTENLRSWQIGFVAGLKDALVTVFANTSLDPAQLAEGQDLLTRSVDWVNRNLWVSP